MARTKTPERERFLSKLPARPEDGSCWEWPGGFFTNKKGEPTYGVFMSDAGTEGAHRSSHRLFIGPIPEGKSVLHSCDNMKCVLPDHLSAGTKTENAADRDAKGRGRTPGHPDHPQTKLTPEMIEAIRAEALKLANARGSRYGVLTQIAKKYPVTATHLVRVCVGVMDHLPRYKIKGMNFSNEKLLQTLQPGPVRRRI